MHFDSINFFEVTRYARLLCGVWVVACGWQGTDDMEDPRQRTIMANDKLKQ
jgi:hypothetical protein